MEVRMHGWWAVSYVMLWLVVVALALLVLALARQVGTLHLRLGPRGALEVDDEGPLLGDAPEPVDLVDTDGRSVSIGGPGEAQLLLFVSPGCPVCRDVMPSVGAAARAGGLSAVVIADAGREDALHLLEGRRIHAPVVPAPELSGRYGVPGTPFAVILDALGVVRAKGTVNSLEQLEGLVDTARRRLDEAPAEMAAH
jgi:methylamine dehydrogenase accessory protein MauD